MERSRISYGIDTGMTKELGILRITTIKAIAYYEY